MERFDLGELSGAGVVSQVFSTGDFLVWSGKHSRAFMCFRAELNSPLDETPKVGSAVLFRLIDGRMVSAEVQCAAGTDPDADNAGQAKDAPALKERSAV